MLARQVSRISGDLTELDRLITTAAAQGTGAAAPPAPVPAAVPPAWPAPAPAWQWSTPFPAGASVAPPPPPPSPAAPPPAGPPPAAAPPSPRRTPAPAAAAPTVAASAGDSGWIGKLLAVAGVAVTLVGVVLLLVLAAKAGLLRPQIRVAGGGALSLALLAVANRLQNRPGGRIGAIALAATGIAAAYLDVIAVTTIYRWVSAPLGLIIAAIVGGAGLTLARRWDSEHLALLVLVPMIVLAPVITGGVDLLLIAFMLALSAASLPVQLGKDWIGMHAARMAAAALPLLAALVSTSAHDNPWLLGGACGAAAILAIVSGLALLPATTNPAALAVLTAAGTLPVLAAGIAVDHWLAAILAGTLAAGVLAVVLLGAELPRIVVQVWSALSAVSALIAVNAAFAGYVAGPVLLALAIVVAVAGRRDVVARWAATGFGAVGGALFLGYAPPSALLTATVMPAPITVATLAASPLVIASVITIARAWAGLQSRNPDIARMLRAGGGAVVVYAVTTFTVTAGVLVGGADGGFLAGHMAATICWITMAAALFVYAQRQPNGERRTVAITGGLALTAAATAKLFLFDLSTLDGIFRVAAFIVVGLVLLGMGAGYARNLAQHDRNRQA